MGRPEELERLALLEEAAGRGEAAATRDSEAPSSSAAFATDDFLYHLYRGSDLLQENRVGEAKEELERALGFQPLDIEGQGLLGVVYFRLGLYPRAIAIYEEIIRARPEEQTPRLNLGLCYFKTGQLLRAQETLSALVDLAPDHTRAWGYLGLVHERLGELAKAAFAFERAGQPQMARRMRERLASLAPAEEPSRPELAAVRAVAADAVQELDGDESGFSRAQAAPVEPATGGRWLPVELGEEPMPTSTRARRRPPLVDDLTEAAAPSTRKGAADAPPAIATPRDLADSLRLGLPSGARSHRRSPHSVLLRLEGPLAVRMSHVHALVPETGAFSTRPILRRSRQRELAEPLGGSHSPLRVLEGNGLVLLAGSPRLLLLELGRGLFYLREDRLAAFDCSLSYESGRLAVGSVEQVPMVQVSGAGVIAVEAGELLSSVDVSGAPVVVRGSTVLGWLGRLMSQPLPAHGELGPGMVRFDGEGTVFVDPAQPRP